MSSAILEPSEMESRSRIARWATKNSLQYFLVPSRCCGNEVKNTQGSRYDLERFGCIQTFSPEKADLLIVAGVITRNMARMIEDIYAKMTPPSYVMAVGSCAARSGIFGPGETYATLESLDQLIPVDVYVPGCPPRPESIMYGLIRLQEKISGIDQEYIES